MKAESAGAVVDPEDLEIEELVSAIPDAPGPEFRDQNIEFRKEILFLGDNDPKFARAVNLKCSKDVVFWFNTFVWTRNPKDFPKDPHQPVILFPNQRDFVLGLHEQVEIGEPCLLEKSREQLATVSISAYCFWRLCYRDNASALIGSAKKDLVDGKSYSMSIFPKIDYVIRFLPDWMLPEGWNRKKPGPCRRDMFVGHPANDELAIIGDTCNEDFARSGRFALVWVDEFASITKHQEGIHTAVGNTTNCFVYTTTPKGLELFARMVRSGDHKVFSLHWTTNYLWHPKGYKPEQCQWNREDPKKSVWPSEWICAVGCKVHPNGGQPHSERYDAECKKLNYDPVKIAQELDINYQKSGSAVFDQDKVLAAIAHLAESQPEFRYYRLELDDSKVQAQKLSFNAGAGEDWYKVAKTLPVVAVPVEGGPLKVYEEPFSCRDKDCLCKGSGVHTYLFGGDVCRKVDQDSHCGYVWDATAGRAVAEWHGKTINATDLAVEWAKLCKWYGSSTVKGVPECHAAVENNDLGQTVNEGLFKMGVPIIIQRNENSRRKRKGVKIGVVMDKYTKPYAVNKCLQPEIDGSDEHHPHLPRLAVPFMGFWKECQTYVYKYNEKAESRPENAKMGAQTRKDHDDRVMAMACVMYLATRFYGKVRGYVSLHPGMQAAMAQRRAA